jgi:EmrB/QacA subfamily drug resistance transporter
MMPNSGVSCYDYASAYSGLSEVCACCREAAACACVDAKEKRVTKQRVIIITIGVMLSMFLSAMEGTVVSTAMPTIAAQLGGLEFYSWVFSAYMLASTTTVPLFGKLSDIFGRKPTFAFAMGVFLIGSLMCGAVNSMEWLIAARAVQGLGAGGLLPLSFIIVGELFTLEQRAKMQGVFSGVWGVSSIIGPLLGGFIVDNLHWSWVFYINIPFGLLSFFLVWWFWVDQPKSADAKRPAIDYAGATLLTLAVVSLLMGLFELGTPLSYALLLLALALFAGLAWVEQRAEDPIIPLPLFRLRTFTVACVNGLFAGWAMFGSISFVPLFVQAVMGTDATQAGASLMPLMLGWVGASIIGSRILLTVGYRNLALAGMLLLSLGTGLMMLVSQQTPAQLLYIATGCMGVGMGLSVPSFLIAVQTSVERAYLGTATSMVQFSRSIGGTLGVSVMGAALSLNLAKSLSAMGIDPSTVSVDSLIEPVPGSEISAALIDSLREALTSAIHAVFLLAFIAAVLALVSTFFTPRERLTNREA